MTRQLLLASSLAFAGLGLLAVQACQTTTETTPTTSSTTTTTSSTGGTGAGGATGGSGGTTGGAGQGGGGGGPIPSGLDVCPGDPFLLDQPKSLFLTGDTTGATNDYGPFCASNTGPELVYHFTVGMAGTLKIAVASLGTLDPILYIRKEDVPNSLTCTSQSEFLCFDLNPPQAPETEGMDIAVTPGEYFLFVDGANGSLGAYNLFVDFTAPLCGDKVINAGEECDDGNNATGDGCDGCHYEVGLHETCTDPEVLTVAANVPMFVHGWTTANTDDVCEGVLSECGAEGSPTGAAGCWGHDRVLLVTPSATGTLTVTIGNDIFNVDNLCASSPDPNPLLTDPKCWDHFLYVYPGPNPANCGGAGYLHEAFSANLGETVILSFPVIQGNSYFIINDAFSGLPGYYGEYWMHLNLQ